MKNKNLKALVLTVGLIVGVIIIGYFMAIVGVFFQNNPNIGALSVFILVISCLYFGIRKWYV